MRIIGFNFEKISAERKKPLKGKLQVKSNIEFKNIERENLSIIKDSPVLKFSFTFSVLYEPEFAEVLFNGFVLVAIEEKQVKEIFKKWKTKKIPEEVRIPLFNIILTKCNLKALEFEEELSLPFHIPLPRVSSQPPQGTNYTG